MYLWAKYNLFLGSVEYDAGFVLVNFNRILIWLFKVHFC